MLLQSDHPLPGLPGSTQHCVHVQDSADRPVELTFHVVLALYLQPLRAMARHLCRSRADAEDLVQETLTRAYVAFSRFDQRASPRPWLMRIMHNVFVDLRRRRARWRFEDDAWLSAVPQPSQPTIAAWRTVDADQIESALCGLAEELRSVFTLRWLEHRSYQEIAALLQIPVNTVGTRLLRARREIRRAIEDGAPANGDPRCSK